MEVVISNHPYFTDVKRKLVFNPLVIDYSAKTANWGFNILHFDAEDNDISDHLPSVQGNFHIDNDRVVNAQGIKIPIDAEPEELAAGIPEFDFLSMALKQNGVDPLTLGVARVQVSDSRGNLNSYKELMGL